MTEVNVWPRLCGRAAVSPVVVRGGRSCPCSGAPSLLCLGSDGWTCLLLVPLTVLGMSKGMSTADASLAFPVLGTGLLTKEMMFYIISLFLSPFSPSKKSYDNEQH